MLPWEQNQGSQPWQTVSAPVYPRVVTITRPAVNAAGSTGFGLGPYQGVVASSETTIVASTPAAIQVNSSAKGIAAKLPADALHSVEYLILVPQVTTLGTIEERDMVTDELGNRYQIFAAYWTVLGYQCKATLVEL
jgi:hypothetical protein